MRRDMLTTMPIDICIDMRLHMSADMDGNKGAGPALNTDTLALVVVFGMCVDMCADICVEMRVDMYSISVGICLGTCRQT